LKSSIANNFGETFELGPHFYRISEQIVVKAFTQVDRFGPSSTLETHKMRWLIIYGACASRTIDQYQALLGRVYFTDDEIRTIEAHPIRNGLDAGRESRHLHRIARIRHGATSPMFSRKMALEFESVMQGKAHKVCNRMQAGIENGVAGGSVPRVPIHLGRRHFRVCVQQQLRFPDKDDLGAHFFRMVRGVGPALWALQQSPSLQAAVLRMPP
jgi:hypothetical protein